jgi:SAM-dependent methyltransferase
MSKGTDGTRRYYDSQGWRTEGGVSLDRRLFWAKEKGPIRAELHRLRAARVRSALEQSGTELELLECGCGDNPQRRIVELCRRYTGVDFSSRGLALARSAAAAWPISAEFLVADVCALPFADGSFDAVYCAHMIYHIEDPAGQAKAIDEMLRVVRPGGVAVVIAANPFPWLFPLPWLRRLAARALSPLGRLAARTPLIGPALRRIRGALPRRRPLQPAWPHIPYRAMPISWMRRRFARHGNVEIAAYSLPSTAFAQRVTEHKGIGRRLWQGIRLLERPRSVASPYLGHYVLVTCRKQG